jgi:uncharacterized RDD family membrane protein YckC
MNALFVWSGRIAGIGGVLLCALAVGVRFSGTYWIAGLQVGTLLLGGIAAMTFACLCFLWILAQGSKNQNG